MVKGVPVSPNQFCVHTQRMNERPTDRPTQDNLTHSTAHRDLQCSESAKYSFTQNEKKTGEGGHAGGGCLVSGRVQGVAGGMQAARHNTQVVQVQLETMDFRVNLIVCSQTNKCVCMCMYESQVCASIV